MTTPLLTQQAVSIGTSTYQKYVNCTRNAKFSKINNCTFRDRVYLLGIKLAGNHTENITCPDHTLHAHKPR